MDKFKIADKVFTFKFPSFKRTQKITEMTKDIDRLGGDWQYCKELLSVMFEEDVNVLDENYENDTIGFSNVLEAQNAFFTSTVKTVNK